jgi:hypothetical protein
LDLPHARKAVQSTPSRSTDSPSVMMSRPMIVLAATRLTCWKTIALTHASQSVG